MPLAQFHESGVRAWGVPSKKAPTLDVHIPDSSVAEALFGHLLYAQVDSMDSAPGMEPKGS